ncbi:hypothetical protein PROFUN_12886 [Planoprotostelium fungivorum]|uniref:Uncharacterized protein n=1 Tax=Planoprotostelium fungivorum TaxID=1890364 RepID=A0A2P6MWJ7_9EUKA|nr:hypothetical protein PROFUN_12886 [Planoprotostelium fungivorum]
MGKIDEYMSNTIIEERKSKRRGEWEEKEEIDVLKDVLFVTIFNATAVRLGK